jgi:hypothetical protein
MSTPKPEKVYVRNALDNSKLNLKGTCPTDPNISASLSWSIYINNPRATVFFRYADDENHWERISANMDAVTFYVFLTMLGNIVDALPGTVYQIANKNYVWTDNVRAEDPSVVSHLNIGKDEDGKIWISVTARDKPNIPLYIGVNEWHTLHHTGDIPFTQAETSQIYTQGYKTLLKILVASILNDEFTDTTQHKLN